MKRSIIAAAVFLLFMSAGVFAADVDTGTLTIKGILQNPCKIRSRWRFSKYYMPTVPTTVF